MRAGISAGEHALIQMAEDTGGKYYYVVDPKDLEPAFKHVSDDLRTQYLLGYYAPKRGRTIRTGRLRCGWRIRRCAGSMGCATGVATMRMRGDQALEFGGTI